tara:strand:+ start:300 stop:599 length:300 start_codon:yes stop_codon:yes gene_type:complete
MDFLDNTNVRHAIFLVAGAVLGISGVTFFGESDNVDQVVVVDSIPAVTAEAVVSHYRTRGNIARGSGRDTCRDTYCKVGSGRQPQGGTGLQVPHHFYQQ